MRVIIYDLDLTLADTTECQPYMATQVGREYVVSSLKNGRLQVSFYDRNLISDFNSLAELDDCCVLVVSDSPKEYCLEVLRIGGYSIDPRLVLGSQGKPFVKLDLIESTIADVFGDQENLSYLVIGDSPKDVYFAHIIRAASICALWGSRFDRGMIEHSRPSRFVSNNGELRAAINDFLNERLSFEYQDFAEDYLVLAPGENEDFSLLADEIGYGAEYVPDYHHYRGDVDKWNSRDLKQIVKRAKDFDRSFHNLNSKIRSYGQNGLYDVGALKTKSGHFKRNFLHWCRGVGLTGKIALVPVPSSLPLECNLTFTVGLICDWWADWISHENADLEIEVVNAFERFWPKVPAHLSEGRRSALDQFETLGMYGCLIGKRLEADHVVIVDDVVTSGSHINALAYFIRSVGLYNNSVPIWGYALYKTVNPEPKPDEEDWF